MRLNQTQFRKDVRAKVLKQQKLCPLCLKQFIQDKGSNSSNPLYPRWDGSLFYCAGMSVRFVCRRCNTLIPRYVTRRGVNTEWRARVKAYLANHNCRNPRVKPRVKTWDEWAKAGASAKTK